MQDKWSEETFKNIKSLKNDVNSVMVSDWPIFAA